MAKRSIVDGALCTQNGKITYVRRGAASAHLRSLKNSKHYSGEVYRCHYCGGFHVGGSDKRERTRRMRMRGELER